jgi:hypothetical protein
MSRSKVLALILATALCLTLPVRAQNTKFEKLLVPVFVTSPLPGAFGSLWTTDLWMTNDGDIPVGIAGGFDTGCYFPVCSGDQRVQPRTTFRPRLHERTDGLQGTFIVGEADLTDQLSVSLRFRDLSRQSGTWGTAVPVVHERDFRSGRFSLVDIPLTAGFRSVLRVYELNDTGRPASVLVRIYALDPSNNLPSSPPDRLIQADVFPLQFHSAGSGTGWPGFLAVNYPGSLAQPTVERVRLEIEPVTDGLRLWGFVTVVNNETQHATVITPQ